MGFLLDFPMPSVPPFLAQTHTLRYRLPTSVSFAGVGLLVLPVFRSPPRVYGREQVNTNRLARAGGKTHETSSSENILRHPGHNVFAHRGRVRAKHQIRKTEDIGFPQASVYVHRRQGDWPRQSND